MILEGTIEGWFRLLSAFFAGGFLPVLAFAIHRNWGRGPTVATLCSVGPILLALAHGLTGGHVWTGIIVLGLCSLAALLREPGSTWQWLKTWTLSIAADLAVASVLGVQSARVLLKEVWSAEWVYRDIMWHSGVVAEVRDHFPPFDPQWASGLIFEYHWLCHAVLAAASSIVQAPAIETVLNYAPTAVMVATFAGALQLVPAGGRTFRVLGAIAIALAFATTWLPNWGMQKSLGLHLSAAMSTYAWSLPLLSGTLFWWVRWQKLRTAISPSSWRRSLPTLAGVTFLATAASLSKGSHVLVIGGLELAALTLFLASNTREIPSWVLRPRLLVQALIPYAPLVLALFIVKALVFTSTASDVVFRLEDRDFLGLEGFPLLLSSHDLWLLPLIVGWPWLRLPRRAQFFLLAAAINFAGFLALHHHGSSDMYFAFNAVLLSAIALISARPRFSLPRTALAFALITALAWGLQGFGAAPNFIANAKARTLELPYGQSLSDPALAELSTMHNLLTDDALVSIPYSKASSFEYAGLLETRTWAGASRYSYVTDTPYAWNRTGKLEDPKDRKKLERRFARNRTIHPNECKQLIERHGWTHLLLSKKKSRRVSACLRGKPKTIKRHWVLYDLTGP